MDISHDDASTAAGLELLQDFGTFYQAGITTWDAADHYGPAEVLIGRYLQQHPEQRQNIQVTSQGHYRAPPPTNPPRENSGKCTIQGVMVSMWAYHGLGPLFN
jgi:aryl-alcohol dehydrogenase-like predicted oxidoreductase